MLRNRQEAGRLLGELLRSRPLRDPLVLGIPRGGAVVAAAIAAELGAEMDIVLARKIRAPRQPELALGAVDEDGEIILLPFAGELTEDDPGYLDRERAHQQDEIERRKSLFRAVRPAARIAGRSVIVTDDGIATGSTVLAALHSLRNKRPHEVIVAVPVAAADRLYELRTHCNDVLCLSAPRHFRAIGEFYDDFTQVDDAEVLRLLRDAASAPRHRRQEANHGSLSN